MRNFGRSSTGKFILSILRSTNMQITIYGVLQWVTIFMEFILRIQLCIVIQVQMIHKWLFGLSGILFILLKRFLYCSRTKAEAPFCMLWASCMETGMGIIPKIDTNLYSVSRIIVLKMLSHRNHCVYWHRTKRCKAELSSKKFLFLVMDAILDGE
jgi:hypothetical protein